MPPWSSPGWEQVPLPLVAEPMSTIELRDGRVLAVGQSVVELVADQAGGLRAVSGPARDDVSSGQLAFGLGRALLARLSHDGAIELSRDHGRTWSDVQKQGEIAGVCVDESGALVAAIGSGKLAGVLRSADGSAWSLTEAAAGHTFTWQRPALVAACASSVAVGTPEGTIDLSGNGGADWSRHQVPRWLTSIAFVPASRGAVLVGTLFVESEDKSYLFAVGPGGGLSLVADLSPAVGVGSQGDDDESEGLGRAESVVWDEARGWLWIAGRFGLQAWRPLFPA